MLLHHVTPRRDLSRSENAALAKLRKFKVGTDRKTFVATEYDEAEEYILPSNIPEVLYFSLIIITILRSYISC